MTGATLRYLSVCSGIEAATVAWHPLGWEPVAFSEIEPFPCAVLNHHYPHVPNLGDMTKFQEWPDANVNVLVGGTPCQSFSVAGLRKGLDDPRGNLILTFGAIASRYRPTWLVWENVPGVLSSNGGRDFGTFLGMLAELGYGFAYRVLDAQYVRVESHRRAVPQRRRRVFVVGHLGDWRRAAAVLFERESLSWDSPPSRKAGEGVAGFTQVGVGVGGEDVSGCLRSNPGSGFRSDGSHVEGLAICMATGQASAEIGIGIGTTLNCNHEAPIVLMDQGGGVMNVMTDGTAGTLRRETHGHEPIIGHGTQDPCTSTETAFALGRNSGAENTLCYPPNMRARRLTPVECERLQGFPDTYTLVPYNTKPAADSPRYKALGNSMAVPVMQWIGQRIQQMEAL